jgi:hypothetical protein
MERQVSAGWELELSKTDLDTIRQQGLLIRRDIVFPPDGRRLKVFVRSRLPGLVGSLSMPIENLPDAPPDAQAKQQ